MTTRWTVVAQFAEAKNASWLQLEVDGEEDD